MTAPFRLMESYDSSLLGLRPVGPTAELTASWISSVLDTLGESGVGMVRWEANAASLASVQEASKLTGPFQNVTNGENIGPGKDGCAMGRTTQRFVRANVFGDLAQPTIQKAYFWWRPDG